MKLTNEPHVPDAFDAWMVALQMNLPKTKFVAQSAQVDLKETYLGAVPDRQHHNCRCCLSFLYRYGDTYWRDASGALQTIWSGQGVPKAYKKAAAALHDAVVASAQPAKNPLALLPKTIGEKQTGQFTHFYAVLPMEQNSAKVLHFREGQERMDAALANGFTVERLTYIQNLLVATDAYRSDKIKPMLEFCLAYAKASAASRVELMADAHDGLTHPRASVLGSLVEDALMGKPADAIVKAYKSKMDGLAYQRPQAAPKVGTIRQAEKLFHEMQLGPALFRRCINNSDIPAKAYLWKPKRTEVLDAATSVFSHLHPAMAKTPQQLPERRMTWTRFQAEMLPMAEELYWYGQNCQPITLMTATHPSAPPILRWDNDKVRNPVSWFFPSSDTAVRTMLYKVHGVLTSPENWGEDYPGAKQQVIFKTDRLTNAPQHSGLFPECLRHELREVRSVIEASNAVHSFLDNTSGPDAQGVVISPTKAALRLKVVTKVGTLDVVIDQFS